MIGTKEQLKEKWETIKDDQIIELTVKTKKSNRSKAQNDYYWWVIIEYIADFIWLEHNFEKMELHKQVKDNFWLETTTNLDTGKFSAMVNEIIAWYKEYRDLHIPKPNEHEDFVNLCETMWFKQ